MPPKPTTLAALVSLSLLAFAANSVLARAAIDGAGMDALVFTALRLASGALILLPLVIRGQGLAALRNPDPVGVASLAVYAGAFALAYVMLGTGTGALILFAAVQVTILAHGFLEERCLRALDVAGVGLAMSGLVVLVGGDALQAGSTEAVLTMALAGVAWGLYTVRGRKSQAPALATAANFAWAALLLGLPIFAWAFVSGSLGSISAGGLTLAISSGALASGIGYTIWYRTIPYLSHATTGAVQLATPAVAALGAAAFLAEPIGWRLAAGGAIILGGIALTLRQR
ncbi:DMT family transporter [Altererythrobacter sp. MTPC7]|uniref:DMT family transporter n=1 Tax=Altererythrobacter sp. MTPC7 TaxID=3056567 RepID=UPI0036F3DD4A